MGRKADSHFPDGYLDRIEQTVTITVCAGEPLNRGDISNVALASGTLSAADWTKSDASPDGRRTDCAQQADLAINSTGEADHVVVDDGTNMLVTTCPAQMLNSGGTVTIGPWGVRVGGLVAA